MLETADRIEDSTSEAAPDRAAGPSSDVDAPPDDAVGFRWFGRMLAGCLVVEAVVVVIALAVIAGWPAVGESERDLGGDGPATSPSALTTIDATESFLFAWRRSLEQDHRATGTLTRTVLGRDALFTSSWPDPSTGGDGSTTAVLPYRHSRLDGRTLTQIGELATVVEPVAGRRTCVLQSAGYVCTAGDGAVDSAMTAVDSAMAAVEQAVNARTATHRIVTVDPAEVLADFPRLPADIECWEARSLTDGVDQRWGRRAQFCFHESSGAAVFRRVLGTTRVEVLVVEAVSETVSPTDLDPA